MNYNDILNNYIDSCPYDEPIFIEDIKKYFQNIITNIEEFERVFKTIYVYINRMVKSNKLVLFFKGIYYKPINGVFGEKKLNIDKVIMRKYILDDNGHKGYYTGAYLYNNLGLTTQIPKDIVIVTNECPNNNEYYNKKLGVIIRKPRLEINDDNYRYLQLFDILNNKDDIKIEVDNTREIIYEFIREYNLEIDKIFEYANKCNNKKAIEALFRLG